MLTTNIQTKIYEIRGQKVMLDFDLAELYGVETKVLNQAVKRNSDRFPADFMVQITRDEYNSLRSQFVTLETGRGKYAKYLPYAFTGQGVSMLSSVLNSSKAIQINIQIIRAFVFMRQYALSHKDLTAKLLELEGKYDRQFKDVYDAISFLLHKDNLETEQKQRKRIGYKNH
jgi:phage regulator Rha-like protein